MSLPTHVAIIMDGNGRWAAQRGWSRIKGHKEGVARVDEIIEAAADAGIRYLTLYAFSTENWRRPSAEVQALMAMLRIYLRIFRNKLLANGIRFRHVGDLDGLPTGIVKDMQVLEEASAAGEGMIVNLAVNYGSRRELIQAVQRCMIDGVKPEELTEDTLTSRLWTAASPDVDLLIRTSGEFRLSNFLLWQVAYAEIYVTDTLWPDFHTDKLHEALEAYVKRERRFGGI
jgi:undecaprenyl diphosphate synthase